MAKGEDRIVTNINLKTNNVKDNIYEELDNFEYEEEDLKEFEDIDKEKEKEVKFLNKK